MPRPQGKDQIDMCRENTATVPPDELTTMFSNKLCLAFVRDFYRYLEDLIYQTAGFSEPCHSMPVLLPYDIDCGTSYTGPSLTRLLLAEAHCANYDARWLTVETLALLPNSFLWTRKSDARGVRLLRARTCGPAACDGQSDISNCIYEAFMVYNVSDYAAFSISEYSSRDVLCADALLPFFEDIACYFQKYMEKYKCDISHHLEKLYTKETDFVYEKFITLANIISALRRKALYGSSDICGLDKIRILEDVRSLLITMLASIIYDFHLPRLSIPKMNVTYDVFNNFAGTEVYQLLGDVGMIIQFFDEFCRGCGPLDIDINNFCWHEK